MWEPPAWDAFSKVNVNKLPREEYEEDEERFAREKAEQTALVEAKPRTINGWDPETKTQRILTDEDMQSARRADLSARPPARPPAARPRAQPSRAARPVA
jgi:hypothetical protein